MPFVPSHPLVHPAQVRDCHADDAPQPQYTQVCRFGTLACAFHATHVSPLGVLRGPVARMVLAGDPAAAVSVCGPAAAAAAAAAAAVRPAAVLFCARSARVHAI
jgi:hypothetical protein